LATSPAAAGRIDEIRFRILLPPQLLRRSPDASERLSRVGKDRSRALGEILAPRTPDLAPLVREALCDPDPRFRKTAATHVRQLLGEEAPEELRKLLEDADAKVRKVARKELRKLPKDADGNVCKAARKECSQL
jgi:HEAT repeat protein